MTLLHDELLLWRCGVSTGGCSYRAAGGADHQTVVGSWNGKEVFTDADNLGISFSLDLDVKVKATLLGALFLIDFMYFEDSE